MTHLENYLLTEAINKMDKLTREQMEYEATLCDLVVSAFGQKVNAFPTCPQCGSRIFKTRGYYINFTVPFIDGGRIVPISLMRATSGWKHSIVECASCGLEKEIPEATF